MPSPKSVPSGRTIAARPPSLEQLHDEHEEQVGGLPGAELGREVVLDAVLFHAAERRVGEDHVHPVLGSVVPQRAGQGVVVADAGRHVDAVDDHVGDAQQVRQRLLLDAADAGLELGEFCSGVFDLACGCAR